MPTSIPAQRAFFDAIAERYDRAYALSGAPSRERLQAALALVAGARRVLVLGIGTGRELPALLDAGHEVTGFELSPGMIAVLSRRARTAPVVEGDFWTTWPFADGAFDAVLALHGTLAHPESDDALARFARELGRVLVPGGVAVFEVPGPEALDGLFPAAQGGPARRLVRADGPLAFRHEEPGFAIEGRAFDDDDWPRLLAPAFAVEVRPLPPAERLVVARRCA